MSGRRPFATRWAPMNCFSVSAVKVAERPIDSDGSGFAPGAFSYSRHAAFAFLSGESASDIFHTFFPQHFLHHANAAHGRYFLRAQADAELVLDRHDEVHGLQAVP